jgi:hypothetical protein
MNKALKSIKEYLSRYADLTVTLLLTLLSF